MLPDGDKLTLARLAASAGRSGCSFGLLRFAELFLILGDINSLPASRETSENPSQFSPDLERANEKRTHCLDSSSKPALRAAALASASFRVERSNSIISLAEILYSSTSGLYEPAVKSFSIYSVGDQKPSALFGKASG